MLDQAGPRPFIWWVLLGLSLGGVLIAHAGLQIAKAFPDDVRANAVAAVKKRPRLAAVTAAVAAWTLIYALYCLAYPSGAAVLGATPARTGVTASATQPVTDTAATTDNRDLLAPSVGGIAPVPESAIATVTPDTTPTTTAPPTDDTTPPPTAAPAPQPQPEPEPCPAQAIADALGPQAVGVLCPEGSP